MFILLSAYSFALREKVSENYDCQRDSCIEAAKIDSDENGIYDTYIFKHCDHSLSTFPIQAIGDISKWPPIGILRITEMYYESNQRFTEYYYEAATGNLLCWFLKPERIDTVYYHVSPHYHGVNRKSIENPTDTQDGFTVNQFTLNSYLNINIFLKQAYSVDIDIVNSNGAHIAKILNEAQLEGNFETKFYTGYLANGVYFVVYKIDNKPFIRKFIVSK